jgi:hypothetical protein
MMSVKNFVICSQGPTRVVPREGAWEEEVSVATSTLLIIVVLLLLLGAGGWGYSSRRYEGPGLLGVVAIILVVLLLTGRLG